MIGLVISAVLGWLGRWGYLWLPPLVELTIALSTGIGLGTLSLPNVLLSVGLLLGFTSAGYGFGALAHRVVSGRWPVQRAPEISLKDANWLYVVAGLGALLVCLGWMIIIIHVGWSDAWWWFEWAQFKYIMLPFFIVAGVLIALGLRKRKAS